MFKYHQTNIRFASWLRLAVIASFLLSTWQPTFFHAAAMKASDDDDGATNDPIIEDFGLNSTIEVNPNFIEPDSIMEEDDFDIFDDDDHLPMMDRANSTIQATTKASKSFISKALAKPKKTLRILRKHQTKIIALMVVFAFRREISRFLYKLVSVPVYGENGKVIGRSLSINITSILKLIFFIQFLMRSLSISGSSEGSVPGFPLDQKTSFMFPRFHKGYIHVPPSEQHWTFERLNERYEKDGLALQKALGENPHLMDNSLTTAPGTGSGFSTMLREVLLHKHNPAKTELQNGTAIVMDLTKLTSNLLQMDWIRDQVSFILTQHRANQTKLLATNFTDENQTVSIAEIEVIVLLESPGGGAADYGLAASQLLRLRNEPGVTLTICVDKVAASGGYMIAATGHKILAAPFAVLGSIGVYGQTINIHDVLEGWGVKDLIFRAGKNKAPLGLLGEVTKAGRETIQTMIDATHNAFKFHIAMARSNLAPVIDKVATGDVWLGCDALDAGLVDRLVTSDEYIGERMQQGTRVLKLIKYKKPSIFFGSRSPSPDYSITGWARSVANEFKDILIGSVDEDSQNQINVRSFSANRVSAKASMR